MQTRLRHEAEKVARVLARYPKCAVAGSLSLLLALAALAIESAPDVIQHRTHLGAEYYNIGLALRDGRGFSDPFGELTGPTAWMPPLYPALLALLIYVFDDKQFVGIAIAVLMNATIVVVGTTLYVLMTRARQVLPPLLGLAFFVLWVGTFHYWFLVLTSDVWLLMLVANLLLIATFNTADGRPLHPVRWGLLGGVTTAISPALALGWGSVVAFSFLRRAAERKRCLIAIALALACAAPWGARNWLVFDRLIPVKANAGFELYQANYVDDDGIFSLQSMTPHPFNEAARRFEYAQLGELAYVDRYEQRFRRWIQEDPTPFLKRVGNRLLAASVQYVPLSDTQHGPLQAWLTRLVYPIPCVLFLVGALMPGRERRLLLLPGLFAAAYLLPYVIAAFYIRYLLPLTPVLCLSVYLALDRSWVWARRKTRNECAPAKPVAARRRCSDADVDTPASAVPG